MHTLRHRLRGPHPVPAITDYTETTCNHSTVRHRLYFDDLSMFPRHHNCPGRAPEMLIEAHLRTIPPPRGRVDFPHHCRPLSTRTRYGRFARTCIPRESPTR